MRVEFASVMTAFIALFKEYHKLSVYSRVHSLILE